MQAARGQSAYLLIIAVTVTLESIHAWQNSFVNMKRLFPLSIWPRWPFVEPPYPCRSAKRPPSGRQTHLALSEIPERLHRLAAASAICTSSTGYMLYYFF
jgi:hypothetical protein